MKNVGDVIGGENLTDQDNGRPNASLQPHEDELIPLDFLCFDPQNRDLPCPICDGKGVYTLEVTVTDPRFGKFQRCPNHPVEDDRDMQARLRRFGNLDAYRDKTFDNFRIDRLGGSYTPNMITSLHTAKSVAEGYASDPRGWIVYEGAVRLWERLTWRFPSLISAWSYMVSKVVFITAPDLLDMLRTTYNPNSKASFDEYFEQVRNVPLLVLDDLGVENPSGWAKEKLFSASQLSAR